jgi:hypothetical protein
MISDFAIIALATYKAFGFARFKAILILPALT